MKVLTKEEEFEARHGFKPEKGQLTMPALDANGDFPFQEGVSYILESGERTGPVKPYTIGSSMKWKCCLYNPMARENRWVFEPDGTSLPEKYKRHIVGIDPDGVVVNIHEKRL